MIVSGVPIMLAETDAGPLLGEKAQTLDNVVPTEYSEAAYPAYAEKTFEHRRMILGMGTKRQRDGFPKSYYYDLFLDGSIGGQVCRGPLFHAQDGAAGQPYRDHVLGLDGGVEKEFAGFGRYVKVRNGDGSGDWATLRDFGASRTVMQMARFENFGGTVTDSVYVTLDDGNVWQYDGALWANATLPAGFAPTAVTVLNEEMFLAGDGLLYSVQADPLVAGNYAGPIFVGEQSSAVNWLAVLDGQLFVFKEDGVFSVDGSSGSFVVTDLAAGFGATKSVDNGRGARLFNDALWFRWGDALWKLTSEGGVAGFTPVGLSVLMENDTEVAGAPVGFAGHNNWFGYFVVASATDSYLCKWGTWINPSEAEPERYRFAEVPHGALFKWTGKIATGCFASAVAGAAANQRLYVGFADGSIEWMKLPLGSPSPWAPGSGSEFTLTPGKRYAAEVDCDWPSENKSWRAATIFAPVISTTDVVRYFFRDTPTAGWTEFTDHFTADGQRIDYPSNFGSKRLQQYIQLEGNATDSTAVVEGWGLHYSVVPEVVLEFTGAADARLYRVRMDGSVDDRDPDIVRQAILAAIGAVGAVSCVMPDRTYRDLNFFRYSEALQKSWQRIGLEWLVPFKAIEFRTNTVYGTWRRVEAYTWAQVEGFGSWRAVEGL